MTGADVSLKPETLQHSQGRTGYADPEVPGPAGAGGAGSGSFLQDPDCARRCGCPNPGIPSPEEEEDAGRLKKSPGKNSPRFPVTSRQGAGSARTRAPRSPCLQGRGVSCTASVRRASSSGPGLPISPGSLRQACGRDPSPSSRQAR